MTAAWIKNRSLRAVLLCLLCFAALPGLRAEDEPAGGSLPDERQIEFEKLLEAALAAAERRDWKIAYSLLEQAESYFPDDKRIESYRVSFEELEALEAAQLSWKDGTPSKVNNPYSESSEDFEGAEDAAGGPKFTIDRGERDPRESPVLTRRQFLGEVAVKLAATDPYTRDMVNTWSSSNEFLYSALNADVRYWLPFINRIIGLTLRNSGYSRRPGQPGSLQNASDLGLNLRGFLLETKSSRLELGLDFGTSLLSRLDVGSSARYNVAFFLGFWLTDPVFYHLFNADSLEDLLFGAGVRIYSLKAEELLEIINFRLDGSYTINNGHAGIRVEWWRFVDLGQWRNTLSVSLTGGYSF